MCRQLLAYGLNEIFQYVVGRHPEVPRFHQRDEGSCVQWRCSTQDPSLPPEQRLRSG
jgi:hypothetical protein